MAAKGQGTSRRKEEDLLRRSAVGDAGAFGEIVRIYQSPVYALALRIVKDPGAAADVAQETFIAAYAALGDLRSGEAFPSWLRTIARNKALARRREQERLAPLDAAGALQAPPGVPKAEAAAERAESEAFRDGIRRVVDSLSEALRVPVLLCYLDGVSTADAARFLGVKEGTLRKRLHDGKKKLQERIVKMAEKTLQEYRLPRDFARRCICGCRRARTEKGKTGKPERR
jgi:RNA polymerase sigma factor (sigma-70 family)